METTFIAKAEMVRSRILASILILSLLYLNPVAAWRNHIYVSPSGSDSQSCGDQARPCKSLDAAFAIALAGTSGANSTLVSAAKGNYTLTKSFNFTSVDSFALVGKGSTSDEVRITCEPNVGLSFVLCQNIALEGFVLQRCGGWRESTVGINKFAHARRSDQGVKFRTALDFRYCRNARFTNIEISFSPGLGVNFFDVGGVVNFTSRGALGILAHFLEFHPRRNQILPELLNNIFPKAYRDKTRGLKY